MSLRHLELADFRIFHSAHIEPEPEGTTVITGPNGTGKTSVLEALAYLGTRRSFRGAPPEALVRTGATSAIVRAQIDGADSPTLVEAEILPAGRSRTRVNRKSVNGRKELAADIKRFLERPAYPAQPMPAPGAPPGAPIGGDSGMDWLAPAPLCNWGADHPWWWYTADGPL